MDELWKSVLAELEIEVPSHHFKTFFKGTKLIEMVDSTAKISAPSSMSKDYIEKRYRDIIKTILDKKTNTNNLLNFSVQTPFIVPKKDSGPLFAKDVFSAHTSRVRPSRIRADYTFDTLAVSESNQLAYTASITIAKDPGTKYNPLFLYGTVGVGKTHLMHAVANKVFDERESYNVLYMTTEEFTNEVVEAIMQKTTTQIRKKFRNVDLLLLDDIQFLSGKEKVQEELFHTFNTLIDRGSQIIFSSDRPPHEIKKIEARLASRFEGGLTVDIQEPDFELRTAILLIKARKYSLDLDVEMAKLISERITDSRALEGFLLKLSSVTLDGQTLTEQLVNKQLGKQKDETVILHPDTIIATVCSYYKIKQTQLKGVKRDAQFVRPRHVCMYLLKEDARLSLVEIGNLLGGRDHTTVMHGVDKMRLTVENDLRVKEDIMMIKQQIAANIS